MRGERVMRKGAPNLYEILKGSKSVPSKEKEQAPEPVAVKTTPEPTPAPAINVMPAAPPKAPPKAPVRRRPVPQTKVAPPTPPAPETQVKAPVAEKVVEAPKVETATAVATPPQPTPAVPPAPVVRHPEIRVRPAEPITPSTDMEGPGERTITVSYNTIAFLALVFLGVIFISYSLGVRSGRSETVVAPVVKDGDQHLAKAPRPIIERKAPVTAERTTPAPAPAEPLWAIHLMEWSAKNDKERVSNQVNAQRLKDALDKRGLTNARYALETRGGNDYIVLYYGIYTREQESVAKEDLKKLRKVTLRGQKGSSRPFKNCTAVQIRGTSK
jgi:hypothetical protein